MGLFLCVCIHVNYFPCSIFTHYNHHIILFIPIADSFNFRFFQLSIFQPVLVLVFFCWNLILSLWLHSVLFNLHISYSIVFWWSRVEGHLCGQSIDNASFFVDFSSTINPFWTLTIHSHLVAYSLLFAHRGV